MHFEKFIRFLYPPFFKSLERKLKIIPILEIRYKNAPSIVMVCVILLPSPSVMKIFGFLIPCRFWALSRVSK